MFLFMCMKIPQSNLNDVHIGITGFNLSVDWRMKFLEKLYKNKTFTVFLMKYWIFDQEFSGIGILAFDLVSHYSCVDSLTSQFMICCQLLCLCTIVRQVNVLDKICTKILESRLKIIKYFHLEQERVACYLLHTRMYQMKKTFIFFVKKSTTQNPFNCLVTFHMSSFIFYLHVLTRSKKKLFLLFVRPTNIVSCQFCCRFVPS